ncbi:uncharacterized protein TNCV_4336661 [Trichonephila clavipes]|nr:uncharacterized protein TNCV_4336661 [Trichonephila clavipes]
MEGRSVSFSDESRFYYGTNDDHLLVRRQGESLKPPSLRPKHTEPATGVDYSTHPDSKLVLRSGDSTCNAAMYEHYSRIFFKQDNAHTHTSLLTQHTLLSVDVLFWPAKSTDLSLIEHLWTATQGRSQPELNTRLYLPSKCNSCQVIYSQFGLAIHQNDHQARRRFVEWAQNEIAVVPDFHKRILFSDEAHFWLNGYVNKQNCRIRSDPQVYVETSLHPEKLTVWCALWAGGIIGPYFFKNDEGHNVTVNGDRYRAMITNFFIPELNNHDVQELWFQQDGAACHTARATIDLLKDTFGDHLISRFGPVNWPPRSCDLTLLDYFL